MAKILKTRFLALFGHFRPFWPEIPKILKISIFSGKITKKSLRASGGPALKRACNLKFSRTMGISVYNPKSLALTISRSSWILVFVSHSPYSLRFLRRLYNVWICLVSFAFQINSFALHKHRFLRVSAGF